MTTSRIVVIHGPVDPRLALTLESAGLSVVAAGADTTVYGSPHVPASSPGSEAPGSRPVLLTIPEAAAELGVGRSTVYRLIGAGQLEVVHVGRSVRVPASATGELVDRLRRRPRQRNVDAPRHRASVDSVAEASLPVG